MVDPNLWAVRPDSKFKTVKDVIEEAKRRPGTITLNGGGHGTDDHVAALGIGANNGTSFQMVHFRGTPEGKTQVLAGNIEVLACNVSEVAEDIKAGQFRILGVMAAERSPFIPNGPTFREQGYNEVWAVSRGIAAPAGLPKEIETALIGYLEKAISLEGAQGQGRGAGARSADHQGRGLPQVSQGERTGDQEDDGMVSRGAPAPAHAGSQPAFAGVPSSGKIRILMRPNAVLVHQMCRAPGARPDQAAGRSRRYSRRCGVPDFDSLATRHEARLTRPELDERCETLTPCGSGRSRGRARLRAARRRTTTTASLSDAPARIRAARRGSALISWCGTDDFMSVHVARAAKVRNLACRISDMETSLRSGNLRRRTQFAREPTM